jgi:hypothetical protein
MCVYGLVWFDLVSKQLCIIDHLETSSHRKKEELTIFIFYVLFVLFNWIPSQYVWARGATDHVCVKSG